jgi:hypothetical protein
MPQLRKLVELDADVDEELPEVRLVPLVRLEVENLSSAAVPPFERDPAPTKSAIFRVDRSGAKDLAHPFRHLGH